MTLPFRPGDRVVYRKRKYSSRPGPRAGEIQPAARGEDYTYHVDKFWTVLAVQPDGKIRIRTRRGKERLLEPDDPSLRKASFWEWLLLGYRFPTLGDVSSDSGDLASCDQL